MAQTIRQRSKSAKSMPPSVGLLLKVYRSNDFLADCRILPIDFESLGASGASFSLRRYEKPARVELGGAPGTSSSRGNERKGVLPQTPSWAKGSLGEMGRFSFC